MSSGVLSFCRKFIVITTVVGVLVVCALNFSSPANAVSGINQQLNFQGRLFNAQGATVPDGYYNIQFKIYQDGDGQTAGNTTGSPAGTLKWTEDYLNADGKGVTVKNGFMSVQLGSVNPFGSSVDWNQDTLWLSMNIGGTNASCTPFSSCTPDGEMVPMKRLSSSTYSLNSGRLGGLTSSQFLQIAQGVQTDASTNTSSIFINKTGTGNLLQFQNNGNEAISLNNTGDIVFGSNASHSISISNSAAGAAGKSLTIGSGAAGTGASALAGGNLLIQGGNGGGTNGNGGNVSIDAGQKNGSGTDGIISIGTSTASTIQIGSTTMATGTQTVNVGNNNTSGSTTNVTIGSGSGATGGSTTVQAKGAIAITSASGNISETATAGTWTVSAYGNSSLSITNGTLGITGNGDTSITSTTGNIAQNATASGKTWSATSNGNSTLTSNAGNVVLNAAGGAATNYVQFQTNSAVRATFDNTYSMYLGAGVTGAANPFTLTATNGSAGVAGSALTVKAGTGGSSSVGGALSLQGGAGGTTSGAGGAVTLQGGAGSAGNSNGGDVTINGGIASGAGTNGNIYIGIANAGNTIQIGNSSNAITQSINIGNNNTANSTTNVTIGSGSSATAGTTTVQGKGNVNVTSASGNVGVTATAGTMTISGNGATSLSSVAGNLSLAGYTGASLNTTTGDTTVGSTAGAVGVSSKTNTTVTTNGTVRATFDTANGLYLGNGVTAATPNNFTINGTGSTTTAVSGGAITLQGGNATVGSANGGNVTISGGTGVGTGVNGIVLITTPTFSTTTNDANCYTGGALVTNSCTITSASVNNSSAVLVGFSTAGKTATMPDPTILTAGRVVYVTAANSTQDFTLSVNGGGTGNQIAMRQNTTATMIWNGSDWTAAGASSSTTLQSAYDNTMQSAGGAELVVSKTGTTNGLTIRDSSVNPVDGTLLSVQSSSAAGLFSVNSNLDEYASNAGAETAGASTTTFPANTWSTVGSSTVSRYITAGNNIATGQASVSVATTVTADDGVKNTLSTLTANTTYNVSFTTRLLSGTFTNMNVYYSVNGTANSVLCATNKFSYTSVWTKVNCSFTAPASGITATNAILIRQASSGTARTFYVDNLSVTIAANYNYATDGSVGDSVNFATNWSLVNASTGAGSVTRNTSDGYDASDSATVNLTTGAANAGLRNKLSINPMTNTLYRITTYAKLGSGTFTDFKIRYSRDGSTGSSGNYVDCTDYNTQTLSTTVWTKITCYITTDGTAATNPYVNFVEGSSAVRSFSVDTFSMTLSSSSTPNVQIGGGLNGGPTTLLTLDRGASAPIASDNDALLGSMYYDTTLGKLQCYEADGWGACGSSPDNVVTISPEYTNAVMHGTGVGTMTSDICSSTLNINDGTSSQPTICGTNETYNFYKWTSPQASAQTYSIYVSYQLPSTFKSFASGQTSIMGRTDSTNSTVQYQIYRNDSASGLTPCGSALSVSTGSKTSWQIGTATGAADPSTCGFGPGNSIVFKINMTASQNANAYVGNLNFIFSNT